MRNARNVYKPVKTFEMDIGALPWMSRFRALFGSKMIAVVDVSIPFHGENIKAACHVQIEKVFGRLRYFARKAASSVTG